MKCVSCRWMRFRLPLLAGGDLLGAERRWADFHLRACPTCRELLASNGAAVDALHAASSEPAPPEPGTLWPALKLRISETRREPVLRLGAPWRRSSALRLAIAASVVALVFGGAFAFSRYGPWRFIPPKIEARLPRPVLHPPLDQASETSSPPVDDRAALARAGESARVEPRKFSHQPAN